MSNWLVSFTILTGLVGLVGVFAALHAAYWAGREKAEVRRVSEALVPNEAWGDALPANETLLQAWLRRHSIRSQSHIETIFVSAWAGHIANQGVNISLLHSLMARSEKARPGSRLASGIAALLLIFGIVGTLYAVHDILKNAVISNAETAKNLVSGLGNAFLPSLVALGFTIAVVTARGVYSKMAHQLGRELDRFIQTVVVPRYRVSTLSEQFNGINERLAQLAEGMGKRDTEFGNAIEKFSAMVTSLEPAIACLNTAAKHGEEASKHLHSRSESLAKTLEKTLGAESPIVKSVANLDQGVANLKSVYQETTTQLGKLATIVEGIGQQSATNTDRAREAIAELKVACDSIPQQIADRFREDTKELLASISTQTEKMNTAIVCLEKSQKESADAIKKASELNDATVKGAGADLRTVFDGQEMRLQKFVESHRSEIEISQANIAQTCQEAIRSLKLTASELLAGASTPSAELVSAIESTLSSRLASHSTSLEAAIGKVNAIHNRLEDVLKGRAPESNSGWSGPGDQVPINKSEDPSGIPGVAAPVSFVQIPLPDRVDPDTISSKATRSSSLPQTHPSSVPPNLNSQQDLQPARNPTERRGITAKIRNWLRKGQ